MDLPSAEQTPKIRFPSQSSSGAFSSLVALRQELWRARGRADPRIPRVAGTPLPTGAARHGPVPSQARGSCWENAPKCFPGWIYAKAAELFALIVRIFL